MTHDITAEDCSEAPSEGTAAAAPPGVEHDAGRGRFRTSLLIGLLCLLVYNANFRSISAGDTYPARYLPFAIVNDRTIDFAPVARVASQGRGAAAFWFVSGRDGRLASLYPIVVPVAVAPLYVPVVVQMRMAGWNDARLDHVARVMEKFAASLLASLSAALLYLLLRRRGSASTALLLTLAYAFGTTTWVTSSQALWQHGLAQLLLVGALLLLTAPPALTRAIGAGLLVGLVAANRPPDAILAAALGVFGLVTLGRRLGAIFALSATLPALAALAYNLRVVGHPAGGYGLMGKPESFASDLVHGLAGLLVSPARGLLVFSPFLLFVVLALRHLPRERNARLLTLAIGVAALLQLVLYAKFDWRGGLSWGPRYMTDLVPLLVWLLVPVVEALRGAARAIFVALVALSVAIQAVGAFCYTPALDLPIYARDRGANYDMAAAWTWDKSPIVTALRQGFAPRELAVEVRGSFDAVETTGRSTTEVRRGDPAAAAGWALADDAKPWQVALMIDGGATVATREFIPRRDISDALKVATPAGWRIPIDTAALEPGEHRLTAFGWAFKSGEPRFLGERTLVVTEGPGGAVAPPVGATSAAGGAGSLPSDLRDARAVAASRVREHQQADGYWLTTHTTVTRYVDPRPEMNTYLTALLVDLLGPVVNGTGLDASVARAKEHLTRQIEAGGLVRYHGLPDGPGIGTLGCAITPDTDDTALAWRIAPTTDRGRLTSALATIESYRRDDGLYRTWLAPRDKYQCLDPGRDPNPADLVIQMHLLQLLAEEQPEKGRALCAVLRPRLGDEAVWVYYRKTPLVAILRLADMRRAGCAIELPESRMVAAVPEQEIWVAIARMLDDASRGAGTARDAAVARALLRELARDDFALLKANPPLLYHNDLTATVPRYYWSEDVGYALWLRLLDDYERARD